MKNCSFRCQAGRLILNGSLLWLICVSGTAYGLPVTISQGTVLQPGDIGGTAEAIHVIRPHGVSVSTSDAEKPRRVATAITALGKGVMEYDLGVLTSVLAFKYDPFEDLPMAGRYPRSATFPAIAALVKRGESSVPFIIDELSRHSDSPDVYYCAFVALQRIKGPTQWAFPLKQYAEQYHLRAKRISFLAESAQNMQATREIRPQGGISDQADDNARLLRLRRIVDLSSRLTDRSSPPHNTTQLIREIGQLNAWESAPELSEFLNYEDSSAKDSESGYGKFPAVESLISMGISALPAVVQTMSDDGRGKKVRDNGLFVVVNLTGSGTAAANYLREQAASYQVRAERLHKLFKSTVTPE